MHPTEATRASGNRCTAHERITCTLCSASWLSDPAAPFLGPSDDTHCSGGRREAFADASASKGFLTRANNATQSHQPSAERLSPFFPTAHHRKGVINCEGMLHVKSIRSPASRGGAPVPQEAQCGTSHELMHMPTSRAGPAPVGSSSYLWRTRTTAHANEPKAGPRATKDGGAGQSGACQTARSSPLCLWYVRP